MIFLLFKTRNSWDTEFNFDFIYEAEDAAEYLKEKKIAGTGIDSPGIERAQEGHQLKTLKKAPILHGGCTVENPRDRCITTSTHHPDG
jgi:kynurenine formamidase